MKDTKLQRMSRLLGNLDRMGFSYSEAQQLRRIEMTLHRCSERECNGEVERDEATGKTYQVSSSYINGSGPFRRWPTPDRESGALKRLASIMARHPDYVAYNQGDPRGCALYVVAVAELRGQPIDQVYNRGLAICI